MNANKLAHENKLSRKTLSVHRDNKHNQITVTEQITCGEREEIYYYFADDSKTSDLNAVVSHSKEQATFSFLGLSSEESVTEVKEVVTQEEVVEIKAEVKAKPAAKKTRAKAKPKVKLEVAPEPVAETSTTDDGTDMFVDDPLDEAPEVATEIVLYDKANKDHAFILKPTILEKLGKDWKDRGHTHIVRGLTLQLHEKMGVTDVEGNVLDTFIPFCEKFIETELKKA